MEATATALEQLLPSDEWTVFHDVPWPGRPDANIDHVAVGPAGVFVIDSGNWSGNVKVRRDVLRQKGRLRDKALSGPGAAASAIGGLLPGLDPQRVKPVLCFARDENIMGWGRNVMVCSSPTLVPMLFTHPAALSSAERGALGDDLSEWTRAASQDPEARPVRRTAPRHSSARRAGARRSTSRTRALLPVGLVSLAVTVIATNLDLVKGAGQLLSRVLG